MFYLAMIHICMSSLGELLARQVTKAALDTVLNLFGVHNIADSYKMLFSLRRRSSSLHRME